MPSLLSRRRLTSLLIPVLVLAVLIHEVLNTPIYSDGELSAMREKAVGLAAAGEFDAALEQLRALSEVAPRDRNVWGDYLAVLVRAGREKEALNLFAENPQRPLPDYALAELFEAAVRQRDFASARQLADREVAQSIHPQQVADARAQMLAAAGFTETVAALPPESIEPTVAALPQSQADVLTIQPSNNQALLRRSPTKRSSQRVRIYTSTFASTSAQAAFSNHNQADADALDQLALRSSLAVRSAEEAPRAERVTRAQLALIALDEYADALARHDASAATIRNEQLDRVRALTLANHLDDAAAVFEALGDPKELPIYGLLNGSDLYVRRQQPERAQALLDIALQREPANRAVLIASFRNQLDREQYAAAANTLTRLRETANTAAEQRDNRLLSAQLAAYSDRLQIAQTELEAMRSDEPADADVRRRLAQVYRWRGWPRLALDEYRQAEKLSNDPIGARFGAIAALNDVHEFSSARRELKAVAEQEPNHPDLVKALDEQKQRALWQYSAQVAAGQSSGSPVTGSGDIAFDQRLTSPVLNDRFRMFAHQHYDWADFPEGSGSANRLGVGGDYRSEPFDTALELNRRSPGGKVGAVLNGEWYANDHFSVFGEAQADSSAVPLRALNADIDGNSLAVGARYRANESRQAQIAYSRAEFSDDNNRDVLSASYRQTLFNQSRHQLGLIAQAYYGRNSAGNDVPYFNPARETAATINLEYGNELWRRDTTVWSQRLSIGAGVYDQKNYGSDPIWDLEYEQRLRLGAALEINYGLLHRSRVYDGGREGYSALFGGVSWRF